MYDVLQVVEQLKLHFNFMRNSETSKRFYSVSACVCVRVCVHVVASQPAILS